MAQGLTIRGMNGHDAAVISGAFKAQGWEKPVAQYERYFRDQKKRIRAVLIGSWNGEFAGYLTVLWRSGYPPFRKAGIPEISDLNVLRKFQRKGIASGLMDEAERLIAGRSRVAGIGVGLYPDYGPAQVMYVKRGYIPDGRSISRHGRQMKYGARAVVDDELILCLTKDLTDHKRKRLKR